MNNVEMKLNELLDLKSEKIYQWAENVYNKKELSEEEIEISEIINKWSNNLGETGSDNNILLTKFICKVIKSYFDNNIFTLDGFFVEKFISTLNEDNITQLLPVDIEITYKELRVNECKAIANLIITICKLIRNNFNSIVFENITNYKISAESQNTKWENFSVAKNIRIYQNMNHAIEAIELRLTNIEVELLKGQLV